MIIKIEDYFTFFSKEVFKTKPNCPYVPGRVCKVAECKHKQRNESHYHCKLCDYVWRGRQNVRMERHLISKHAHAISLYTSSVTKSGSEKSENGKYSVLDHSYTYGENDLPNTRTSEDPPTMLMLPHFFEKESTGSIAQENPLLTRENQENNQQHNLASTLNASSIGDSSEKTTTSNTSAVSISSVAASSVHTASLPNTLGDEFVNRMLSNEQFIAPLPRSVPSSHGSIINDNRANGNQCIVPNCKNANGRLKKLLRMKSHGHAIDWESTMLLLTFHRVDIPSEIANKFICFWHWKEWYNYNYKLKKHIPYSIDVSTQTK